MVGFPKELQEVVLKGRKQLEKRAGELLEPVNFDQAIELKKNCSRN
jgi:pyruvate carboxylase